MLNYRIWDKESPINTCPAEEAIKSLKITPAESVYIITENGRDIIVQTDGNSPALGVAGENAGIEDLAKAHLAMIKAERLAAGQSTAPGSLKDIKKSELNKACEMAIFAGVDVETSQGVKRFSLTTHDQSNLNAYSGQVMAAKAGMPSMVDLKQGVLYHADGEPHKYWPVEDFEKITAAAFRHVTEQSVYCSDIKAYVDSLADPDEIVAVTYGMEIPAEKGE